MWGNPNPLNFKPPITPESIEQIAANFHTLPNAKVSTRFDNFVKITQGWHVVGRLYSEFRKNLVKFSVLVAPHPHPSTDGEVKFGMEESST